MRPFYIFILVIALPFQGTPTITQQTYTLTNPQLERLISDIRETHFLDNLLTGLIVDSDTKIFQNLCWLLLVIRQLDIQMGITQGLEIHYLCNL
jgi:hypothetical protein